MDSSQGVEQGVSGGVVAPITQVDTPHEGDEAPLEGLIAHVGIGCWLGPAGRAVVTWAAPPHLLQLVFGPGALSSSSPGTACSTDFHFFGGVMGDYSGPCIPALSSPRTACSTFSFEKNIGGCGGVGWGWGMGQEMGLRGGLRQRGYWAWDTERLGPPAGPEAEIVQP